MRGDARERRMLHEHEIVLFSFMFAFFVIGLFIWGLDADASEYSVNGVTLIDGNSISILAKNGVTESRDLVLKNSLAEGVESSSIVILEVDSSCELLSDEVINDTGEVMDSVCDNIVSELVDGSVIYADESGRIKLSFTSEYSSRAEIVFNIITTEGINTFVIKFESTEEGEVAITVEEEVVNDNPLVDLIQNLLGVVEEELLMDTPDPIVYVDEITEVGLTLRPQLVFGSQDISEAEQKTKTLEFENIGSDAISFEGVEGKLPGIILTGNIKTALNVGERASLEITCAPSEEMSYEGNLLTLVTSRGNLNLEIYCSGVVGVDEVIDEVAPIVSVLEPATGAVEGIISVKLAAYDEGSIYDVAVLKVYADSTLIKRYTDPPIEGSSIYEFDFDTGDIGSDILEIYAVAVDYAGNEGSSEKVSLWINSEETVVEPTIELDFGSGYFDVKTPVPFGVTTADLKITYSGDNSNWIFEFKSIDLPNLNEVNIDKTNAILKSFGSKEVIDIPDSVMNYIVDELNAQSIIMPLAKPNGYVSGDDFDLIYYRADGTSFDLVDEDIIAITEGSNGMLNVEVDGNLIRERD